METKSVILSSLQQEKRTAVGLPKYLEWLRVLAQRVYDHRQTIVELAILAAWALWMGRAYLDFDPNLAPAGREYGSAIQGNHLWTRAQQCGWCALWNGSTRGGTPAFADTYGSALHPLVVVTTLIWGVVNGSKLALILALWIAGVAQWWLARVLRLGPLARVWSGLAAVAGGHLAGRMALGIFGIPLSTAMCSLVFAPAIAIARSGNRRTTVLLAIVLALTIVAGQGYIQVGLLFLSPAFLFLVFGDRLRFRPVWREYAIAIGIALLLAAVFLVPLIHFWPNFTKDVDLDFQSTQPLRYFVLNLVIDDVDFLISEALGKQPELANYSMYIGWVPILLAALCLKFAHGEDHNVLLFLGTSAILALLTGSGVTLRWFQPLVSSLAGLRFAPLIGGLAIPPILGLAAYGLDKLFAVNWPRLELSHQGSPDWRREVVNLKWLLLVPLIWSLHTSYDFSHGWLHLTPIGDDVHALLAKLRTPSLQWVATPFGEHRYVEPAIRMGLKLSPGIMPWGWKDRDFPEPYLEATRSNPPPGSEMVGAAGEIQIYRFMDQRDYAFVQTDDDVIPCQASGTGGDLRVECSVPDGMTGTLIVRENSWSGWYAWRGQAQVPLLKDRWLRVDAPAGEHRYRFRYLPGDVPLGMFLSLLGIVLSIWKWLSSPDYKTR